MELVAISTCFFGTLPPKPSSRTATTFREEDLARSHTEELRYLVPSDGRYAVVVDHDSGGTPDWLQVTVWGVDSIDYYTESGSIGNPGESANPGMLAVGAAHLERRSRIIEPLQQPRTQRPDGRVKPDIVGADCGATALVPL